MGLADRLQGRKTYLLAIAAVLAAGASYLSGEVTLGQAVQAALEALGLAALRAGVARDTATPEPLTGPQMGPVEPGPDRFPLDSHPQVKRAKPKGADPRKKASRR